MADDKDKAACLDSLLEHAATLDEVVMVMICQGPPRCDYNGEGPPRVDCPYCLRTRSDDPRSPEEIIAEMGKVQ